LFNYKTMKYSCKYIHNKNNSNYNTTLLIVLIKFSVLNQAKQHPQTMTAWQEIDVSAKNSWQKNGSLCKKTFE